MPYFFPNTTFIMGTITPQKIPAAAICGSVNTLTTPLTT